jgi:hypothetical protein
VQLQQGLAAVGSSSDSGGGGRVFLEPLFVTAAVAEAAAREAGARETAARAFEEHGLTIVEGLQAEAAAVGGVSCSWGQPVLHLCLCLALALLVPIACHVAGGDRVRGIVQTLWRRGALPISCVTRSLQNPLLANI